VKISDSKVIPNGYTGCVLMGKNKCAYFDEIVPINFTELVQEFPQEKSELIESLNNCIQQFVTDDATEYCQYVGETLWTSYSIQLGYYISGNKKFSITSRLDSNLLMFNPEPQDILLGALVYFISSLANYKNLKVEYIKRRPDMILPGTIFCPSNSCTISYEGANKNSFGISFDTPADLRNMPHERTIIYAIMYDNPYRDRLEIRARALSGRIINTGTAVNVFQIQAGNPIIVHKLDGISEFNLEGIQELPLITSDDIIE